MMRGLHHVMLLRCAGGGVAGHCWCTSFSTCRFQRCENCDMPVDQHGTGMVDPIYVSRLDREAGPCPQCNGPMPKP